MQMGETEFTPDTKERVRRMLVREQIAKFEERIILEMRARPDEVPEMIMIETEFGYICEVRWTEAKWGRD